MVNTLGWKKIILEIRRSRSPPGTLISGATVQQKANGGRSGLDGSHPDSSGTTVTADLISLTCFPDCVFAAGSYNQKGGQVMKQSILLIFLVACLALLTSPCCEVGVGPAGAAEAEGAFIGLPTADTDNIDPDRLVPLEIVNRIALKKAQELWGHVTPGNPIACCDQDGNIAVYMCPFRIGGGPFPGYDQIMQGVRAGRALVKEVEEGHFNPPSEEVEVGSDDSSDEEERSYERDAQTGASYQSSGAVSSELRGGTASKPPGQSMVYSYQAALKEAREIELGIGEYGTIYVSARYDLYPIPLCSHYLSPYYFSGDLAQGKARKAIGSEPVLTRYYFLGRLGQYFEFASDSNTVTIQAYSLEVEPIERLPRADQTQEQLEDVRQEWDRIAGPRSEQKGGEGS